MDGDEPTTPRRPWHTDTEWLSLLERITGAELIDSRARRNRTQWRWLAAAAGFIALLLGSLAGAAHWRNSRPQFRVAATSAGQRIVIRLPDSSTVTLGPASTLRYDQSSRNREMTLEGIADFRVQHDPAHPFVVHTSRADVSDIGTEFVVRAYTADSTVHVAVNTGVVAVVNRVGDRGSLTLHAGEVALVQGVMAPLRVRDVNPMEYSAWIGGTLTFDDDSLADVARELGRWFDVDVRISDAGLAKRRVSGIYNNPSLSSVLDALGAAIGVRYERSGRIITLRAR